MKNKRIIITTVMTGLLAGFLSSCMDNFLDKPAHNMTPSVSLNDPIKLSSSVYSAILTLGGARRCFQYYGRNRFG